MSGHPGAVRASQGSGGFATALRRRSVVALAALLTACWYPKERGARLEQRVDRIEGEGQGAAGVDAEALREQSRRVDAALAQVKAKLEALDRDARAGAPPTADQAELLAELKQLRATLEQHGQRLDAVERSLAQAPRAGPTRVAKPSPAATEKAPKPPSPAPGATAGETGVLALAREQEQRGEKTVARELYEQYVTQFPTDPSSAEAHFRLGELAFGDRRYRDAVVEYGKVAQEFPRSARAPDALLRTAESMLQLGMKEEAASVLAEIPQRYPKSAAAARARTLLAESPGTTPREKRE